MPIGQDVTRGGQARAARSNPEYAMLGYGQQDFTGRGIPFGSGIPGILPSPPTTTAAAGDAKRAWDELERLTRPESQRINLDEEPVLGQRRPQPTDPDIIAAVKQQDLENKAWKQNLGLDPVSRRQADAYVALQDAAESAAVMSGDVDAIANMMQTGSAEFRRVQRGGAGKDSGRVVPLNAPLRPPGHGPDIEDYPVGTGSVSAISARRTQGNVGERHLERARVASDVGEPPEVQGSSSWWRRLFSREQPEEPVEAPSTPTDSDLPDSDLPTPTPSTTTTPPYRFKTNRRTSNAGKTKDEIRLGRNKAVLDRYHRQRAAMTPDELNADNVMRAERARRNRAKRQAAMTPDELAAHRQQINARHNKNRKKTRANESKEERDIRIAKTPPLTQAQRDRKNELARLRNAKKKQMDEEE